MSSRDRLVRRALLISLFERYGITSFRLSSAIIFSRLLTREVIGIFTVGVAVIGIAHVIGDFGIGQYLLQEKSLTPETVASALGLTMALAWTLGGLLALSAPYISIYYKEPSVKEVVFVVALNFLITPLSAMAPALLKRSMSFGSIFKINLTAALVGAVVGVTLATRGFGFMSMAWASVASVAVSALMSQLYMPKKYRVKPSLSNIRTVFSVGSHVILERLVVQYLANKDATTVNSLEPDGAISPAITARSKVGS